MTESRRRTAATVGLVAAGAAGAVGFCALAHTQAMVNDSTFTDSAGPTGVLSQGTGVVTSTSQAPGLNGAPMMRNSPGAGSHTKSHGS